MAEPQLCPKCGALVGAQLKRCYQCKTFLMGSSAEGFFLNLIPEQYRNNPATNLIFVLCLIPFVLVFFTIGAAALTWIPPYTMTQQGASHSVLVVMGQYWRLITANFIHFNAIHLLMNMLGLMSLGPLIEKLFDYKKCFILFFLSGTLTFAAFMGVEYLFPALLANALAGGASAGIFGLLGAGVAGAQKYDWRAGDYKRILLKSFFQNLVLGLIILPWGSTVLHVFGFLFGFGIASLMPAKEAGPGLRRSFFSYLFLACLLATLLSYFFQAQEISRYSLVVDSKGGANRIKQCFFTTEEALDSQEITKKRIDFAIKACEILIRETPRLALAATERLIEYADKYPTAELSNNVKSLTNSRVRMESFLRNMAIKKSSFDVYKDDNDSE